VPDVIYSCAQCHKSPKRYKKAQTFVGNSEEIERAFAEKFGISFIITPKSMEISKRKYLSGMQSQRIFTQANATFWDYGHYSKAQI